jgi:hypothetical protein
MLLIQPPFSQGQKQKTKKNKKTGSDGCLIFKIQKFGAEEDLWTYAT